MSIGRSLKATFDYLVGTLGGAIYGGAIGVLVPHSNEIALLAVLAIAVAPLALIAAINPRFSVAPIFALGFALEQMHHNFKDLERCVAEWAGSSKSL